MKVPHGLRACRGHSPIGALPCNHRPGVVERQIGVVHVHACALGAGQAGAPAGGVKVGPAVAATELLGLAFGGGEIGEGSAGLLAGSSAQLEGLRCWAALHGDCKGGGVFDCRQEENFIRSLRLKCFEN